jgi:hypothetical protein
MRNRLFRMHNAEILASKNLFEGKEEMSGQNLPDPERNPDKNVLERLDPDPERSFRTRDTEVLRIGKQRFA